MRIAGLPAIRSSIVQPAKSEPKRFLTHPVRFGQETLKAFLMGDIHINNHTHKVNGSALRVRRPLVVENLQQIVREANELEAGQPNAPAVSVVLNGDIFDLTESWPHHIVPSAISPEKHLETVKKVIDEIIGNNPEVIDLLKQLLKKPNVNLFYVLGNHERWLGDREAQLYLKKRLNLDSDSTKLTFSRSFYEPSLKLMAVHGDQFDPYCRPPEPGKKMNDAEKLDILVIKQILNVMPERLKKMNLPQDQIAQVQDIIRSIEYVRPVQRAFSYGLDRLKQVSPKVCLVVVEEALKTLGENLESRLMKSTLSSQMVRGALSQAICNPVGTYVLNKATSMLVKRIRSDANQLEQARLLLEQEGKDVRILVLGHTHKILDQTIPYTVDGEKRHCRVMNPGSYKATILYPNPDATYPAGIIKIVRSGAKPEQLEVDFSIQQKRIIQGG